MEYCVVLGWEQSVSLVAIRFTPEDMTLCRFLLTHRIHRLANALTVVVTSIHSLHILTTNRRHRTFRRAFEHFLHTLFV